jgi:hypothetical protein
MPKRESAMRKLKLQVQMSVDGYIAGPNGEMPIFEELQDKQALTLVEAIPFACGIVVLHYQLQGD